MKRIILLSVGFPYGNHEPFLRNELRYHKDLILASAYIGDERNAKNNMPDNVNVTLWHKSSFYFRGNKVLRSLAALRAIFTYDFWQEVFSKDIRPIRLHKIITLLSYISKSEKIVAFVSDEINKAGYKKDELIFYSYWMDHLALASVKLAQMYKGKAVTRCHGYDVYPREGNYVVMQRYLTKNLDRIFPIAVDGAKTICSLFKCDTSVKNKTTVFRLGTEDFGMNPPITSDTDFTIVSCSNVVPLKRVDMIFDAINKIDKFKIHWYHFGDGVCFEDLKKKVARSKSKHNVNLMGRQSNETIMNFYKSTPVHLFINLSTSEGIPVSIMEALSFGIPCLGTDVGGVHEIIKNNVNGYLIPKNSSVEDVSELIQKINALSAVDMLVLRKEARLFWENNYRAEKNYSEFVECLLKKV